MTEFPSKRLLRLAKIALRRIRSSRLMGAREILHLRVNMTVLQNFQAAGADTRRVFASGQSLMLLLRSVSTTGLLWTRRRSHLD